MARETVRRGDSNQAAEGAETGAGRQQPAERAVAGERVAAGTRRRAQACSRSDRPKASATPPPVPAHPDDGAHPAYRRRECAAHRPRDRDLPRRSRSPGAAWQAPAPGLFLGSLLGAESAKECLGGSVTRRSLRDSVCQPLFPTSPFGNLALPASAGGPLSLQRFPSGERAPALWQRAPGGGRCPSLR